MKRKVQYFIVAAIAGLLWSTGSNAQSITPSVINSAGGSATIGGNIYEYSVGEMVLINTMITANMTLTNGFLQPFKIGVSAVNENFTLENLRVFPNPASHIINVEFPAIAKGALQITMYDLLGKQVYATNENVESGLSRSTIDISSLAAATYMLHISYTNANNTPATATYKIEKLQ